MIAYHVVTDKPMYVGQRIIFDEEKVVDNKEEK